MVKNLKKLIQLKQKLIGQKRSEMVKNSNKSGQKWSKIVKTDQNGQNGPKWSKTVKNGQNCQYGHKRSIRSKTVLKNCLKTVNTVQKGHYG